MNSSSRIKSGVSSILYAVALIILSLPSNAQEKFGKDLHFYPEKLFQEDGIIIIGRSEIYSEDLVIYKTNNQGDSIWSNQYALPYPMTFQDYVRTNDTTFYVLGWAPDHGITLIKADTRGDTLWTRLYLVDSPFLNGNIVNASDGGFIISFNTRDGGLNNIINLMKTSVNGDSLWAKTYGSSYSDVPYNMVVDPDGGYLIAGHYSFGTSDYLDDFPMLLKVNQSGDSIWLRKLEYGSLSGIRDMIRTNNNELMIAGISGSSSLVKANTAGDSLWFRRYQVETSRSEAINCIVETTDGFLVGGSVDIISGVRPGSSRLALFKMDQDGNLTWYRLYSEALPGVYGIDDVLELEHNYLLVSRTQKWLFSTDKNGCLTPDPEIVGRDYFCTGDSSEITTSRSFADYTWSTGDTSSTLIVTSPGDYYVTVRDSLNCHMISDTVTISEMDLPDVRITPISSEILCQGDSETLTAEIANFDPSREYLYQWRKDLGTGNSISVEADGLYEVNVTDKFGCENYDSLRVILRQPFAEEKICVISVDPLTGKNLVVWEKTPEKGILSYNIYRDQGNDPIGNLSYDHLSIFVDETADPRSQQYLYSISVIDTCGNESPPSPWHKPLFLQYVSSVDGVNLRWSKYEIEDGEITFDNLEIWRGSDSTSLGPIARNITIFSDAYTDIDPNAIKSKYYYRVAGVLKYPCVPTGSEKSVQPAQMVSLSNMDNNKYSVGVDKFETSRGLKLFPNPFSHSVSIQFSNPSNDHYILMLTDLSGKVIRIVDGITTSEYRLNREKLDTGMYLIELRGPSIYKGKILVE